MEVLESEVSMETLQKMASNVFGDMLKAVVDVNKRLLAVDAELHADLESMLLEKGSEQKDLWGINLYPFVSGEDFIEFDSLINIRPAQGNRSRYVEDGNIRMAIIDIVHEHISQESDEG